MGKLVVRAGIVCVVAIIAACGGKYGTDGDDDSNETPDSGAVTPTPPPPETPGPSNFDGGDASSDVNVDGGPAFVDVSASCIRAPSSLPHLPATHVVSVYEGVKGDGGVYVVNVKVTQKDTVLVLASFTPEQWRISFEGTGSLSRVFVRITNGSISSYELVGVPNNVPVSVKASQPYARGWTRDANSGGGKYAQQIATIRDDIGGLETTYQGTYTGTSFTVGGALPSGATGIESYDTRTTCADPCSRAGTVEKWQNAPGSNATITALSANGSSNGAELRTDDGARCGKHYFEIQTTTAATVALTSVDDAYPLVFTPASGIQVPASTRVGVAVDYEANTITYTTKTGNAAAVTQPVKQLGAWYRESIGPAYYASAQGTVTLVTRAPFALPRPTDYAADF